MHSPLRTLIKGVSWVGAGMVVIVVFHLGGTVALRVGQFSPLTGAFIGGALVLVSVLTPVRIGENTEPWIGKEQMAWMLIGFGMVMWGIGDSFWRYYVSMGQTPFPSIADIGYSSFPLLAFTGLLLQPSSASGSKRMLLLMDSLISMGSVLAIAWYLLLGPLAQAPGEANLAKFLGLYYPISDTALLSCVLFLLLRGQGRNYQANARRTSLLVVGLGLCFFVTSDFIFNIQQNAGTYVEATWIDLGWPLGMMTIGVGACLRRFLPATPSYLIELHMERHSEHDTFGPARFIPYGLLAFLFLTLTLNVLDTSATQLAIRPVLLLATMSVVGLVVLRQILTLWENVRLARQQAEALEDLERANQRIEEQARQIAEHNEELEQGIAHLKGVQAQLANGNMRARAHLTSGALLPLAGSLNIMAERLTRLGQFSNYAQSLVRALGDLSGAFERSTPGAALIVPASCADFVEINRFLLAMRRRGYPVAFPEDNPITHRSLPSWQYPVTQPLRQQIIAKAVSESREPFSPGSLHSSSSGQLPVEPFKHGEQKHG